MITDASSTPTQLQQFQELDFWRELNPGLSVLEDWRLDSSLSFEPEELEECLEELRIEGYFHLDAILPEIDILRMAIGIDTLVEQNLMPVFAFVYDEYWQTFQRISSLLSVILGAGYQQLPAFWAWFVPPSNAHTGWKPHRDRCTLTLRPDGTPNLVTIWIPLTDATPLNGCMSLLPAHLDPNYPDNLNDCSVANPQDIRALTAIAGSVLCWNHSVLHWGGRSSHKADFPRISMAFEFQRGDVPPYQAGLLPPLTLPTLETRLRLISQQILQYKHMYPLSEEFSAVATALSRMAG
jgi:hypothetical protein